MKKRAMNQIVNTISIVLVVAASIISCTAEAGTSEKNKQVIRFAMEATYPPFEYTDPKGEIQGFDVDIAHAICYEINADCSFSNQPWDSLIPSLQLGKFDALISAISITPERERQVAFTNPYFKNSVSFVVNQDSKLNPTYKNLRNQTVGVQAGTTLEQFLRNTYGNAIVVKTYASYVFAFLDLRAYRLDAVLVDTPIAEISAKHSSKQFKVVGDPIKDTKYFGTGFAIVVRKNDAALLNQLNQGLAAIIKDGTYQHIMKKYFGD